MGVVFYVTFPNLDKSYIPDNFLNFFAPNDVLAVIARAFLLVQMVAIFPLLMYILRIQVRQKIRKFLKEILYCLYHSSQIWLFLHK